MTIAELRRHLETLDPSYDDLDIVVKDPNETAYYGSNPVKYIEGVVYVDNNGYLMGDDNVESLTEKQLKKAKCYAL